MTLFNHGTMGNPNMGLFPEMVTTTRRYGPGKVCQGGPKGGLQNAFLGSFLTKIDPKDRDFHHI